MRLKSAEDCCFSCAVRGAHDLDLAIHQLTYIGDLCPPHRLGKAHGEVQNHPKCISRTQSPLVNEKEDAGGFYLGAKTTRLKSRQSSRFTHGPMCTS